MSLIQPIYVTTLKNPLMFQYWLRLLVNTKFLKTFLYNYYIGNEWVTFHIIDDKNKEIPKCYKFWA